MPGFSGSPIDIPSSLGSPNYAYQDQNYQVRLQLKGTVRTISRNLSCKDDNSRFTTVSLKGLANKV